MKCLYLCWWLHMILQKKGECEDFWENACENLDEIGEIVLWTQWTGKLKYLTALKTKRSVELITLFKFFTRQEEKGNKGLPNGRFANFTKGFNSTDGLVLNKLIFMSAMKAFYFSNSFSQLTFRPNYFNVLYVSLILKTTCTLEFL